MDVLLLYGPPWHGAARFSKHHLARYLAGRGHRVLYVEAPLGPLTLLRRRREALPELRETLQAARAVERNVWVCRYFNPIPYHDLSPITATRLANRLGQRLLAPLLRRDLRRLGLTQPLVIAGLPHALDLLPGLPRGGLVYHCSDDFSHVRGFPRRTLPALEAELCQQSDLVIATAQTLCEARKPHNPQRTFWIPNGVDVAHFGRLVEPAEELRAAGQPVVGFVGGLAQWVDVSLIAYLARARPGYLVPLIGPISTDVAPLRGLANVRLLGPRPYDQVPRYLAAMDVALIPFVNDPVTYNADPIKAYEYLATGVPVVATRLPALERLAHVIRLAESPDTFVAEVDAAVQAGRASGRAERQAEAARHSWTSRFERFEALVAEHVASV